MFSKWPIRVKLLVGLGLLVVMVAILSSSGLYTHLCLSQPGQEPELAGQRTAAGRRGEQPREQAARARSASCAGCGPAPSPSPATNLMPLRVRLVRQQFRAELGRSGGGGGRISQAGGADHAGPASAWPTTSPSATPSIRSRWPCGAFTRSTTTARWIFSDEQVGRLDDELDRLQVLAAELSSPCTPSWADLPPKCAGNTAR